MLYRQAISWPVNAEDDDAIDVSFVKEHAHGNEHQGADDDGEVVHVRISNGPLVERLTTANLGYPNAERDALYADIFAAAEASSIAGQSFAGTSLPGFTPEPNVRTVAELDEIRAAAEGITARLGDRSTASE